MSKNANESPLKWNFSSLTLSRRHYKSGTNTFEMMNSDNLQHQRLMKKIISPEDFFKIECEKHMSFKFNEFHKYIINVFDFNDDFLYYPDKSNLPTQKYQDISLKTSKCDIDPDIAMML
jgi:hypothetical protein